MTEKYFYCRPVPYGLSLDLIRCEWRNEPNRLSRVSRLGKSPVFIVLINSEMREVFFWAGADLIALPSQRSCWPIDGLPLKLNSDSESSARQPMAVNHASDTTHVTDHGADHEPVIPFPGFLCQETHTQRTDVFRGGPLGPGRIIEVRNLHRQGQLNAFFKSTRPRCHECLALSFGVLAYSTKLGSAPGS